MGAFVVRFTCCFTLSLVFMLSSGSHAVKTYKANGQLAMRIAKLCRVCDEREHGAACERLVELNLQLGGVNVCRPDADGDTHAPDAEYNAELPLGDILPGPSRAALKQRAKHWPNATLPYKIHADISGSDKATIKSAMRHLEQKTCVKFTERTDERNYIYIAQRRAGCGSQLGMQGGPQSVNLPPECLTQIGTAVHEFLHALGFIHEHNRPDRDQYITVAWKNIKYGAKRHFSKESEYRVLTSDTDYDYGSIMHYGRTGFTATGKDTIVPRVVDADIGQRTALSDTDIKEIKQIYCTEKPPIDWDCYDESGTEYCEGKKIYCSTTPWYQNFVDKQCQKTCQRC